MRKLLLAVLVLLLAGAGAAAIYWRHIDAALRMPGPHQQPVQLLVKPGATVRGVLADLDALGAIADRQSVEMRLRVRGWPQIRTGRYEIPAQATPEQILEQLESGRVVLETLTVIEGWTFADMRQAVEQHPQIKLTLRGRDVAEIMKAIGHEGEHPEGRFFPDTYRFAAGTSDRELYSLAYRKLDETLQAAW